MPRAGPPQSPPLLRWLAALTALTGVQGHLREHGGLQRRRKKAEVAASHVGAFHADKPLLPHRLVHGTALCFASNVFVWPPTFLTTIEVVYLKYLQIKGISPKKTQKIHVWTFAKII